jgi:hypothetical protein
MTTTVKKGSGRAAAAAKTTKAAQKTALPEKAALLEEASKLGLTFPTRSTKADILAAIRARAEPTAGSAEAKLARLTAALKPFGWRVTVKASGERTEATAKRGRETLVQVWVGGAYGYGASQYANNGSSRKVRNLSEAIRLCAVQPE